MNSSRSRRLVAGMVAVAGIAVLAAGAQVVVAASEVPKTTNASATPARFCVRPSSTCTSPGTTIRFTISTKAHVRINMWPRFRNEAGYRVFRGQVHAGTNAIPLSDARLYAGRWQIRIQGRNNVGSGTIATTIVRVYK